MKPSSPFTAFVCGVVVCGLPFTAHAVELSTLSSTSPSSLSEAEFPSALLNDWVVVRAADDGDTLDVFDRPLTLAAGTTAIVGINSELVFVAVLAGGVETETGETADAGDVVLRGHFKHAAYTVHEFDALDFSGRLRRLGADALAEGLASVITFQQWQVFFGLMRSSRVNVNKPYSTAFERGRRHYTLHPILLRIKSRSDSDETLAVHTASTFVTALDLGDADAVAALLSPMMFLDEGRTPYTNESWIARRRLFAQTLCDRAHAHIISPAERGAAPGTFRFSMGRDGYLLTLRAIDGNFFVEAVAEHAEGRP